MGIAQHILDVLKDGPRTPDELVKKTGIPLRNVEMMLNVLGIGCYTIKDAGGRHRLMTRDERSKEWARQDAREAQAKGRSGIVTGSK